MDNSNHSRNRHSDHLGVNKIGKNIRKSNPMPQSNLDNPAARPVSQPQVYSINKNDFRNIVQQLTGSPFHNSQEPVQFPRPPVNPPRSPSTRLQRIRPPPLVPMNVNRPRMPVQVAPYHGPRGGVPMNDNNVAGRYDQFVRPPQRPMVPPPQAGWPNIAESSTSAYMHYLQHSINDPGHPQTQSAGLLPNPHVPPPFPSPRMIGLPPLLPSPNSQFLLPSPSGYLNLSSPRSPYPPLFSPGYQQPSPLTPNLPFSPGILGSRQQSPRSPGTSFPPSPGFFSVLSPRWRD